MYYASYSRHNPEALEIVGVADPNPLRRNRAMLEFGIDPSMCFPSAQALASVPRFADFAINGTMDNQHVPTSLPLLERGYHLLLEKPFAINLAEMWQLVEVAKRYNRHVAICHVLRYTPFYAAIRGQVLNGTIGNLINIQATEHVSYHHMAVGYVRGKWRKKVTSGSSMLMAKSCHDLDLICWMKSGIRPTRVSSFGGNFQFRPENAPEGAGTRCLVDCPIEAECLYSARKHYLDHPDRWAFYVWDFLENLDQPTENDRIELLKTSPYGLCAWRTDMDVVDHQSVVIEFADGSTATLNMIGGSAKPSRSIHLVGTKGEIEGKFEDNRFVIRHIDPSPGMEYTEGEITPEFSGDTTGAQDGHGGGDMRMVADFLSILSGKPASISSTGLQDSVSGHLVGFYADQSMETGQVFEIQYIQ